MSELEKRLLPRLACSIVAGTEGQKSPMGELVDINLDGGRIVGSQPLPLGSHLPLALTLELGEEPIFIDAEVVRSTAEGTGVRFIKLSRQDSRRLRRFVVELAAITGHRETSARLHDGATTSSVPIKSNSIITDLLRASIVSRVDHIHIPADRQVRFAMSLVALDDSLLVYQAREGIGLRAEDHVFVLYTVDYVSYSFQTKICRIADQKIYVQMPEVLYYSERRSSKRTEAAEDSKIQISVAWKGEPLCWPVVEFSQGGFSFMCSPEGGAFLPGTPLQGASLFIDGHLTVLEHAIVRSVVAVTNEAGKEQLRVGVELGAEREAVSLSRTEQMSRDDDPRKNRPGKISKWFDRVGRKASFLYYKKVGSGHSSKVDDAKSINFKSGSGKSVSALLNLSSAGQERVRAPVVIVVPGYGGRKETFSALAAIISHNFRRQYRDVAVLRIDSTNNLGESEKDPGSQKEGGSNLRYTVSGCIDDIRGAVRWAKNNRQVDATDIVIISSSFSSIAVRRYLSLPEGVDVSHWFVMMGAADAQNCILHVAGNLDIYGNYLRGIKNGVVSLIGCLVDADNFCDDLSKNGLATIEDSRREMARIKAHVTWFVGKQDGYMDPRRTRDVMSIKALGKREIIEVNAGHLPRNSEEAIAQFSLITTRLWRHFYQSDLRCEVPPSGFLDSISEREWKRVRRQSLRNSSDYWKSYLLGDDGIGFDVLTLSPYYRQFVEAEVKMANPKGKAVLDLGAGTGNVSAALGHEQPRSIVAIDLVAGALDRLRQKVRADVPVKTILSSADGSSIVAMRRFLSGDIAGVSGLAGRIPGVHQNMVQQLGKHYTAALHAVARGAQMSASEARGAEHLEARAVDLVHDLGVFSNFALGRLAPEEGKARIKTLAPSIFDEHAGLPCGDTEFDSVVCSLVLSYLDHPEDALFEMMRVLKPRGELIISSMKRDADSSMLYTDLIAYLESAPAEELATEVPRERLVAAARQFANQAAELLRLEEEGVFTFWSGRELTQLVQQAGFVDVISMTSFGTPGQAVIVKGTKPK